MKNIARFDKEMDALKGVRLLRHKAEKSVERIIVEVWGER